MTGAAYCHVTFFGEIDKPSHPSWVAFLGTVVLADESPCEKPQSSQIKGNTFLGGNVAGDKTTTPEI